MMKLKNPQYVAIVSLEIKREKTRQKTKMEKERLQGLLRVNRTPANRRSSYGRYIMDLDVAKKEDSKEKRKYALYILGCTYLWKMTRIIVSTGLILKPTYNEL